MPKSYLITDRTEVSRGQLTPVQILRLNKALAHHGLPVSSPHSPAPETLAKVCLKCASIALAPDVETRDFTVANFDMTCCGLTVVFRSSDRVLINPDKLTLIRPNQKD